MSAFDRMTGREKTIMALTVTIALGCGIYFGFLESFILRYQEVVDDLESARVDYQAQQAILKAGGHVDREFMKFARSTATPDPGGKRLELIFAEEMDALCREMGLPRPGIEKHQIVNADAKGFYYLTLPISGILGSLEQLADVLNGFAQRNLLIRTLEINQSVSSRDPRLEMIVTVAQIVREEDLAPDQLPRD